MSNRITKENYYAACKLINDYEKQEKNDKLKIYEGCSKSDIISSVFNYVGKTTTGYWITKENKIPDREPDGMIFMEPNFYTMPGSHTPYDTLELAEKAMIKNFKRKKLIK